MPMIRAQGFCNTQPTTSAALLRIQLIISPVIPGNTSAAFLPNLPSILAKAFSLFHIHYFAPFSSLGRGLPMPPIALPPLPPGRNASTKMLIAMSCEYGSNCNALLSEPRRAERASNLTFSKCLYLVDLNNPQILMTHDKMAVTANIRT